MTPTKFLYRSRALRLGAAAGGGLALLVAGASAAAAHVSISPKEAAADSFAVLTIGVPHGCDGSPTTEVAIQIPDEITSVTPTVNPNWTVEKIMIELDEPVADSHGNEITERIDQVVYTALTPLPDDLRDAFELSVRLPDLPGETLAIPAVQTCEEGEAAWVQMAGDGQDQHDLDMPAPLLTLVDPAGHGAEEDTADAEAASDSTAPSDDNAVTDETTAMAATSGDGSGSALGIAGLAAGLLGMALGGAALVRVRRQT